MNSTIPWRKLAFCHVEARHPQDLDVALSLVTGKLCPSMRNTDREHTARVRAYRRRLAEAGEQEVLFRLPREIVVMLDEVKEREGLPSRSQALIRLIEQGRQATRHVA